MSHPDLCPDPIFMLGILMRSGTNFLYDLLRLHPDCDASTPVPEDFLVHCADLLVEYVDSVSSNWRSHWGVEVNQDILRQCLGKGLISFVTWRVGEDDARTRKRIIARTPSVRNLELFFELFPRAHLLILVRDGRAVVESSVKSFGANYETMMRHWAKAAQTIVRVDQSHRDSNSKYLIVRYEDLYVNMQAELLRIFAFLGLGADAYDFDAAASLPVKGSSELRDRGEDAVHWQPVEKWSGFNPINRWDHWDRALHERFNWIAGQYLAPLGYQERRYMTNRRWWLIWNHLMDVKWGLRETVRLHVFGNLPDGIKAWLIGRFFADKNSLTQTLRKGYPQ
jgi:hypothetical protein